MSKLIEQLKRHEGLRLKPYKCTMGYDTIGYGRNLETNGISKEEAETMLVNDMVSVMGQLSARGLLQDHTKPRQDVLVNMAFQMGVSGLLKFKNMIAALDDRNYSEAAKQMLDSRWAKQTPNRANELAEQMRTGVYA